MIEKPTRFGVLLVTSVILAAALRLGDATLGDRRVSPALTVPVSVAMAVLVFVAGTNVHRLRPRRAFVVPAVVFCLAVFVDFGVTVLTAGRSIAGPPGWLSPAMAALAMASGVYGLVVLISHQRTHDPTRPGAS